MFSVLNLTGILQIHFSGQDLASVFTLKSKDQDFCHNQ